MASNTDVDELLGDPSNFLPVSTIAFNTPIISLVESCLRFQWSGVPFVIKGIPLDGPESPFLGAEDWLARLPWPLREYAQRPKNIEIPTSPFIGERATGGNDANIDDTGEANTDQTMTFRDSMTRLQSQLPLALRNGAVGFTARSWSQIASDPKDQWTSSPKAVLGRHANWVLMGMVWPSLYFSFPHPLRLTVTHFEDGHHGTSGNYLLCLGEPGSCVDWFMTAAVDSQKVFDYLQSFQVPSPHRLDLGHLSDAPFDVYVFKQERGDLVVLPPRTYHQRSFQGTTASYHWSRMTIEGLRYAVFYDFYKRQR